MKTDELEALSELIDKAIAELTIMECPVCQCYIGADAYLSMKEVRDWLERELKGTANYTKEGRK